jgi:hypothetical protein
MKIRGYFLEGVDKELLLVIRGYDEEQMYSIIKKIETMRDTEIKELAEVLEIHFNDRQNNGRNSIEARPQNKKKSTSSNRGRNRKTTNPKPQS